MAGLVMQTLAAPEPLFDRRQERLDRREGVGEGRRIAKNRRIDCEQQFGVLIGGAPEHDAVDMGESASASARSAMPPLTMIGQSGWARFSA